MSLRESKVKYFQYRFLQRILGTNVFLNRINVKPDPLCTFCAEHNETISHLFWDCSVTSNFILDIEQSVFGQQFVFSKQDIFFGYKLLIKHPNNLLIFHLKQYIFNKKVNTSKPEKNDFLYKFKFILQVEKYLSNQNRKCIPYDAYKKAFGHCVLLFN